MTPRRYSKGAAKQAEILDAALDLIARNGYRDTSLRQIAAAANISLSGLMHYFASKEHLLIEVLRHRDALDVEAIGDPGDNATFPRLDHIVALMSKNMTRPRVIELYLIMAAASVEPDHPAHAYFAERFATFRNLAATAIADAQRDGHFDSRVDPLLAANNLLAVMDGIQMQWLLDTTIDMAEQVESYLSRMASGYAMTTVAPRSGVASVRSLPASTP
ncbi:TetR/AcrR family transcriptional regulator [Propionicicella superfundia]|uniref:TetR/AcrR family transcriptional regulator n=1 Tax=Propionicicella superfundia TaxID=348582 RepID=UPI00146B0C0B|nr:TetR/AcrR family transcriptional regulator [Propionicicella superfundia]